MFKQQSVQRRQQARVSSEILLKASIYTYLYKTYLKDTDTKQFPVSVNGCSLQDPFLSKNGPCSNGEIAK